MSFFVILHVIVILLLFFIGVKTFSKFKKTSGIFFLISTVFLGLWLLFYLLIFGFVKDKDILLYMFRFMYVLSFFGYYSMIFFVVFYGKGVSNIFKNIYFLLIGIIGYLFIFTPIIVKDLKYIADKGYYFEDYGFLYDLFLIIYLLFTPIFILISYFKIRALNYINKLRLKIIVLGFSLFIVFSLLFYVILPYFEIYEYEKIAILTLFPFIFSVVYSIKNYHFFDIKLGLGKLTVFFLSIFWSSLFIYLSKNYYLIFGNEFSEFWGLSKDLGIFDLLIGIILFIIFNHLFSKIFLGNNSIVLFEHKVNNQKKYIPYILDFYDLNNFLQLKFDSLFKIKYTGIKLFKNKDNELYNFFIKDKSRDLFINDIVFIEENKHKFNIKKLKKQLKEDIYLVFPMYDNKMKLIGIFNLSMKPFKDNYYSEEIAIIKSFVDYLSGHLKYIEIYQNINDLNINLDKKVDDKTIEFNELLNRQKEFIGVISHEIKTPLAASVFQIDTLKDDLEDGENNLEYIKNEVTNIEGQLLKVSELTNSLFVNQRYDLGKIKLFKENIDMSDFLSLELEILSKKFSYVNFEFEVADDLGNIDLDRVQFNQVLSNLVSNAAKFANRNEPKIVIKTSSNNKNIVINIEDNGSGFGDIDTSAIFQKYNTGNKTSVGIGMGLYLCDKILSLHGGSIVASNSKDIGGAKFEIILNKN